jgi:hypothetical protein
MHRALRPEEPDIVLLRWLCAQARKTYAPVALDWGNWNVAFTMFPAEDPLWLASRHVMPPSLDQADPFSGVRNPEEIAAGMDLVRVAANFGKARQVRLIHGRRFPEKGDHAATAEGCT